MVYYLCVIVGKSHEMTKTNVFLSIFLTFSACMWLSAQSLVLLKKCTSFKTCDKYMVSTVKTAQQFSKRTGCHSFSTTALNQQEIVHLLGTIYGAGLAAMQSIYGSRLLNVRLSQNKLHCVCS